MFGLPADAPMPAVPVAVKVPAVIAAAPDDVASDDGVVSCASSSSSSSSSSSASSAVIEEAGVAPAAYLGDIFAGAFFIEFDEHFDLIRPARSHTRYIVGCLHHGCRCGKRRGVGARHERRYGRIDPQAFLLAWAQQAERFANRAEHIACVPTNLEIDLAIGVLKDLDIV